MSTSDDSTREILAGRKYRLKFTDDQRAFAERISAACRGLWNAALDQRRAAAQLDRAHAAQWPRVSYVTQCRELTDAKRTETWLMEPPAQCLQQTLRDLDRACRQHSVWGVHWRSKRYGASSFRFPDPSDIAVRRVTRRWGEVKLQKLGWVRFRWTRPFGGPVRHATVLQDGDQWFVSFCVEDVRWTTAKANEPCIGIDCGVVTPIATSDGQCFTFRSSTHNESVRFRRLQQQFARQEKVSNRRRRTVSKLRRLSNRMRHRRMDFAHQVAHRLTSTHSLVVVEDLHVQAMTSSARGTLECPGRRVRQKAGLNRVILDRSWSQLRATLEWHGQKNACAVVAVSPQFTSQTCSNCGHAARESRESQARFRCTRCGYKDNADVNAAKVILAAGLAVTGRGDLAVRRSVKRQPSDLEVSK